MTTKDNPSSDSARSLEDSWMTMPGYEPGRKRAPMAGSPTMKRSLAGTIARTLIEASQLDNRAHLMAVALLTLAMHDQRWALAAMTLQPDSFDIETLVARLDDRLADLIEVEAYLGLDDEEQPTIADLLIALQELGQALEASGGARKREILVAGFHARFHAAFFVSGSAPHLWTLARQIEKPELDLLEALLRDHGANTRFELDVRDHDLFLVRRLRELGLLGVDARDPARPVLVSPLAATFREFLAIGR